MKKSRDRPAGSCLREESHPHRPRPASKRLAGKRPAAIIHGNRDAQAAFDARRHLPLRHHPEEAQWLLCLRSLAATTPTWAVRQMELLWRGVVEEEVHVTRRVKIPAA